MFGTRAIDFKVSTQDTNGALFIIEVTDDRKGGPPRHLHHEQAEWFYVIDGEYAAAFGDERYRLRPGGSILALRNVPHGSAHAGGGIGRQLLVFRPAGKMEAFFGELAKVEGIPQREELQILFNSHGMDITGPPLSVE